MRYLNFLIPLVGLLFLGGLYTYRTYWSPNLAGHWHVQHPQDGTLFLYDFQEDNTVHVQLGIGEYGWGGYYTTLGRQIAWGGECIGVYDYRYQPVNSNRLKAVDLNDDRNRTTYFERHHGCTDYSHWQLGLPTPIILPHAEPSVSQEAYPSPQHKLDAYLFFKNDRLTYALSNRQFSELRTADISLWIENYLVKLPEGKRTHLTVALAADENVPQADYQEACNILQQAATALNLQLSIRQLHNITGKLVTTTD